jgi:hypothetical protein
MPDMQTALKTALSNTLREWDDDGEESPQNSSTVSTTINNSLSAPSQNIQGIPMTKDHTMLNLHKITNNVSRVTFNYVRDNPGSTRLEIIKELGHQGFGKGSVSSLLAQMRKSKMIHDTNGLWYADIKEYEPIKNANYKSKAKPKPEKKATTGLGALLRAKLENTPMPNPSQDAMDAAAYAMGGNRPVLTKLVRTQAPEDIVGNMTVYQARELYLHLKSMFGG